MFDCLCSNNAVDQYELFAVSNDISLTRLRATSTIGPPGVTTSARGDTAGSRGPASLTPRAGITAVTSSRGCEHEGAECGGRCVGQTYSI